MNKPQQNNKPNRPISVLSFSPAYRYLNDPQYRGPFLLLTRLSLTPPLPANSLEFYNVSSDGMAVEQVRSNVDNFPAVVKAVRNKIDPKKLVATLRTITKIEGQFEDVRVPCEEEGDMIGIIVVVKSERMFAFAAKSIGFKKLRLFSMEGTQTGNISCCISYSQEQVNSQEENEQIEQDDGEEQDGEQREESFESEEYRRPRAYRQQYLVTQQEGQKTNHCHEQPITVKSPIEGGKSKEEGSQCKVEDNKISEEEENPPQSHEKQEGQAQSVNQFLPESDRPHPQLQPLRTPVNELNSEPDSKQKNSRSKGQEDEEEDARVKKPNQHRTVNLTELLQKTLANSKKSSPKKESVAQSIPESGILKGDGHNEDSVVSKVISDRQGSPEQKPYEWYSLMLKAKETAKSREREQETDRQNQRFIRKYAGANNNKAEERVQTIGEEDGEQNQKRDSPSPGASPECFRNPLAEKEAEGGTRRQSLKDRFEKLLYGKRHLDDKVKNSLCTQNERVMRPPVEDKRQKSLQPQVQPTVHSIYVPRKVYGRSRKSMLVRRPGGILTLPRVSKETKSIDSTPAQEEADQKDINGMQEELKQKEQRKEDTERSCKGDKASQASQSKKERSCAEYEQRGTGKMESVVRKLKLHLNQNILDIKLASPPSQTTQTESDPPITKLKTIKAKAKTQQIQTIDPSLSASSVHNPSRSIKMEQYIDQDCLQGKQPHRINLKTQQAARVDTIPQRSSVPLQQIAQDSHPYEPHEGHFDIIIRNISVNVLKRSFGQKYVELQHGHRLQRTDKLHGSHLLWVDKAFLLQKMTGEEVVSVCLKNEADGNEQSLGRTQITANQFLLNYRSSFLECYLLSSSAELVAVLILGFQFHKNKQPLQKNIQQQHQLRQSRSVRISPGRAKTNRLDGSGERRKGSIVHSYYEQETVGESGSSSRRQGRTPGGVRYRYSGVSCDRVSTDFRRVRNS